MTDKTFEWNDENTEYARATYAEVRDENYKARTEAVEAIANDLGVSVPRVRSKLVSMGDEFYIGKPKAESNGTAGARKSAYVAFIGTMIGANVPSLEAATKEDLVKVATFLKTANDKYEVDAAEAE